MASRFKPVDREQSFLMPPTLKEWIPANHIVHFTIEAANMVPLGRFAVNERGSGDEQYHPQMLLALLLYCYSHGIFSSRRIENATWTDVAVRFICANLHPDHDTICDFRRRNEGAIADAFLKILLLAKEMKILKLGTVSVDGSKIKANASIFKSIRYDRAFELERELEIEIDKLLKKAESADGGEDDSGDEVSDELARLSELKRKMRAAQEELEKRAKERAASEREGYEKKVRERDGRSGSGKGRIIKEPKETPDDTEQANLTDADSRIMKKSKHSEYVQAYNAQAVVDADGTMLVLANRVTNHTSDANELVDDICAIPSELGVPETVLADKGFANEGPVLDLRSRDISVLIPVGTESSQSQRRHDFRPRVTSEFPEKEKPYQKQWVMEMAKTMATEEAKRLYRLRKQSVEPVFGIIKHTLGFRQFLLRGLEKVNLEWELVICAYNLKRLAVLMAC